MDSSCLLLFVLVFFAFLIILKVAEIHILTTLVWFILLPSKREKLFIKIQSVSEIQSLFFPIPGLLDQLCVELLQVHQQQEHARDCRIPCLRDPSAGVLAA